ncbi:MAG: hypothetical protein CVU39_16400 [Chloroflexi bacterium HGW-Chloroflexi-10]|nr:MAG: hypothetical protein CVU39_16400 [Chloroflexi bacterium HGW-Chloroflexi-10]
MNVWNQVTLVVNQTSTTNESFELYINGYLDSTGTGNTGSDVSTGFGKLDLGNQQSGAFAGGDYIGVMDEVSLYSVTLNEIDVRNTFHYQMEHVEEMESITVTIDADAPQAQLVSYNPDFPYLSSVDRIIQVDALDLTSGIAAVEMILDHQNAPDPQKTLAPVCIDSLNGTSFCPIFDPKFGEGAYELTFRAIDAVGHEQISDPVTLYVDGTPPRVTTNIVLNSIYAALPYGALENTWYLHLGGTLLDEALSGVIAGSGLEQNSVRVTIYNEFGGVVGIGNQQPELVWDGARYNWNHDYLFPENEPTGKMSLVVEASDKVGNLKTAQIAFYLDATAPVGKLDESSVPNTDFAAIIEGSKSADDTVLREQELTGSASDIPGQELPYMSPDGEAAASRVDQVQMGIDPALGVSYLFNEPYPEGLLAWLPLDKEEIPNGASGNPDENAANRYYLDISPWQISGTCEMPNCPQPGQIGHKNGAMYFDGNHRYINLGNQVDLANKSFTISLWAQRESLNRNDPILWQGPLSLARQRFLFGYNTENQMVCGFGGSDLVTSEAVLDGLWHNWACNYDVGTKQRTLWLDGKAVASDTANPMLNMEENLFIGLAPVGSYKGDLDEVVVYDRALTSSEIREQFTSYQPVFHLTVDDDFIRNGDFLNDVSGFYQVIQMKTTAGDISNKVAAGKQGDYALGLNGADRVLVSADYSLNLDRAQFTEMAWVYPLSLTGLTGVFTQNDENPEMRYPSLFITADGAIKSGFGNGYNWFETSTASGLIQANRWNHLAATFDGQTYKIYLNGRLVHSDVSLNGLSPYPSETFALGDSLNGMLDEVSIYPRALSAEEIYAFHQMNWKETTLDNQGNEVTWRGIVPYGLEGSYNVNIRAWDSGSHFTANSKTMIQWGGLVDSFPPRLTVLREEIDPEDPYKLRYTFEVIDTMLDQTTIRQNLCESITYEKEHFNSSWYLAGGVAPNTGLYRIAGTCLADGRTTEETGILACDVGGNCSARMYSAVLTERVYLPLVISSGGGGGSVPEPPSAAWLEKVLDLAQTWPKLIDSQQIQPIETKPFIEFDQDVLTDQDQRSIMHINLKGNVENPSAINTLVINIWKDNELVATTQATIYQNRWNAPWMFLPGNPPENGDYVLEVILTDNSGETTLYNHPITVQGSFSK